MERLLIVNADDLGLAPGVTRGILELAAHGVVTSTSLVPNMPGSTEALAAARALNLDVGLHLNICTGAPLCAPGLVPSLLRPDGRFARANELTRRRLRGRLNLDEVEREWSAQAEWFLATGSRPSHVDSHCHVHAISGLYPLIMRLARRYEIPGVRLALAGYMLPWPLPRYYHVGRVPGRSPVQGAPPYQPDRFSVITHLGNARSARLIRRLLRTLPGGVTELICHPGHVDEELRRIDPLTVQREYEYMLLRRPFIPATLAAAGVRLVSWADVTANH